MGAGFAGRRGVGPYGVGRTRYGRCGPPVVGPCGTAGRRYETAANGRFVNRPYGLMPVASCLLPHACCLMPVAFPYSKTIAPRMTSRSLSPLSRYMR